MIRYTLKCDQDHQFESWFQSAEGFDTLKAAGHVACAVCGSSNVEKSLMAPKVRPARKAAQAGGAVASPVSDGPAAPGPDLSAPSNDLERAMLEMRKQIEDNSDYVGMNFATEARAMHEGEKPDRAIYGEANAAEAKKLIEDGVAVTPLPFMPNRKTN